MRNNKQSPTLLWNVQSNNIKTHKMSVIKMQVVDKKWHVSRSPFHNMRQKWWTKRAKSDKFLVPKIVLFSFQKLLICISSQQQ